MRLESEVIADAQDILVKDEIFKNLVVQRSRTYARESQIRETGNDAVFPERRAPQVAARRLRARRSLLPIDLLKNLLPQQALFMVTCSFCHSRSYHGLIRAPRRSIPSSPSSDVASAGFFASNSRIA